MHNKIILLLTALMLAFPVYGDSAIADRHISNAQLVGKARFKVLFWNVFDAELRAGDGEFNADEPFSLSLSYLRDIPSGEIVAKSIDEMKSQSNYPAETLNDWRSQLSEIIPDVDNKTTITGVRDGSGHSVFYLNGEKIGKVIDPQFTTAFFNIWLGEKTSEPKLRRQLLGL